MHTIYSQTQNNTYIHKNASKHCEMGPVRQNPIQRTVTLCSYVCALHCVQLLHTLLHRTDPIIFPLALQLRWCLFEGKRATIDTGRKVGGGCCCVPFHGGAGSPSNTMLPGPRSSSIQSGILIHPIVWPQYNNVTDRQERQTTVP